MFSTGYSHQVTSSTAGPRDGAMAAKGSKFVMKNSVQSQLRTFAHLRSENPVLAKEKYDRGELLVSYAQQGKLTKLMQLIGDLEEGDILTYHVVKAYKASLLGGHLMVTSLLIDEGYPFNKASVPAVLLEIMGEHDDETCYEIVEFLLTKGYDVDLAAQGTWMTALHVAIRYGHLATSMLLIDGKADVNAVAEGDIMPLALAQKLLSVHNDKEDNYGREEIILGESEEDKAAAKSAWERRKRDITEFTRMLIRRGARASWRQDGTRARLAADKASVRPHGDTGQPSSPSPSPSPSSSSVESGSGSGRPEAIAAKPRLMTKAGTVSRTSAMTVEEARAAINAARAASASASAGTIQPLPAPALTSIPAPAAATISTGTGTASTVAGGKENSGSVSGSGSSRRYNLSSLRPRFNPSEMIEDTLYTFTGTGMRNRMVPAGRMSAGAGAGARQDGQQGASDPSEECKSSGSSGSNIGVAVGEGQGQGQGQGHGHNSVMVAHTEDGAQLFSTG